MRRFLLAALVLVAAVACKGGEAEDDLWTPDPVPLAEDFVFSVTAAQPKVELGGDLVLKIRVENKGDVKAHVNVPRLGFDSVTLRVRSAALSDPSGVVTLDPRPVKETPQGYQRVAAEVKEIGKGEAVESEIRITAVLPGKMVLTPTYVCQALPTPLTADPLEVEVTPAAGGSRIGVRLETSHGTLDAVLRPELAFQTCTMFATLVRRGFYDGLVFHRIVRGFMAQGGDPKGLGWGGPGFALRRELHGKLPHRRGVFGAARKEQPADSVGSQFYIMFGDARHLDDGGYTTFAEMTSGNDTLARIESAAAERSESPKEPVTITKATLIVLP